MNPWAIHADGIKAIQNEAGTACPSFVWGGQTYLLLPGSARLKRDLIEGGYDQDFDFTATALLSTFQNNSIKTVTDLERAMLKTTFAYLGENFRFQSIWMLAGGLQIQLNANAAKK